MMVRVVVVRMHSSGSCDTDRSGHSHSHSRSSNDNRGGGKFHVTKATACTAGRLVVHMTQHLRLVPGVESTHAVASPAHLELAKHNTASRAQVAVQFVVHVATDLRLLPRVEPTFPHTLRAPALDLSLRLCLRLSLCLSNSLGLHLCLRLRLSSLSLCLSGACLSSLCLCDSSGSLCLRLSSLSLRNNSWPCDSSSPTSRSHLVTVEDEEAAAVSVSELVGRDGLAVGVEARARARVVVLLEEHGLLGHLHDELAVLAAAPNSQLPVFNGEVLAGGHVFEPDDRAQAVRAVTASHAEAGVRAEAAVRSHLPPRPDSDGLRGLFVDDEDRLAAELLQRAKGHGLDLGCEDEFCHFSFSFSFFSSFFLLRSLGVGASFFLLLC